MEAVTVAELPALKYNELRALCSSHGLPAKGKKNDLVEALTAHLTQKNSVTDEAVQDEPAQPAQAAEQPDEQAEKDVPDTEHGQDRHAPDQDVRVPPSSGDAQAEAQAKDQDMLAEDAVPEVAEEAAVHELTDVVTKSTTPEVARTEAPADGDQVNSPAALTEEPEALQQAKATEPPTSPDAKKAPEVQDADDIPAAQAEGIDAAPPATATPVDEWENTEVPLEWIPVPLLKMLMAESTSPEELGDAIREPLATKGFALKSVLLGDGSDTGKAVALVRLEPPRVPWKAKVDDNAGTNAAPLVNVFSVASEACKAINGIQLNGTKITASADYQRVVLAIGNLPELWQSRDALNDAMLHFGAVERVCMITNAAGLPKGYAVVEFSLPSAARAAFDAMKKATTAANDRKAEQSKQVAAAASGEPNVAVATAADAATAAEGAGTEGAALPEKEGASNAPEDAQQDGADASAAEAPVKGEKTEASVANEAAGSTANTSDPASKEVEIAAPLRAVYNVSKASIPRCEYAKIGTVMQNWSKTLHVAQLPADLTTNAVLRTRFAALAGCEEAHVTANVVMRKSPAKPRPDGTVSPIGYAFVTFVRADLADTAYRAAATLDPPLCAVFVTPGKDVANSKQRSARHAPNTGTPARTAQPARGSGRMGDRGGRFGRGGRGSVMGFPKRMGTQGRGSGAGAAPARGPGYAAAPHGTAQDTAARGGAFGGRGAAPGRRVMGSGRGNAGAGRMGRGRAAMGGRGGRGGRGQYGGHDGVSGANPNGGRGGPPRRMGARSSVGAANTGEGAYASGMQHGAGAVMQHQNVGPGPIYGHAQPQYVMAAGNVVGDASQYQIVYQQPAQQPYQASHQPHVGAQAQYAVAANQGQQPQAMTVAYVQQAPQFQVQQQQPQGYSNPAEYQAASFQSGYEQGFAGAGQKRGASYASTYPGTGFDGNKRARY